ncbi:Na/Pi symporter [Bacillus sp. N1-1]|jgi:phosphate:Na+ symporter|uniref:Na/Pi symporter n=1 Tax=Bacillus sp. N1-1 TaxID=2682541 RepID=UPI0013172972|nr:Na/Pi symporter [Bacillus sp. N1-1]QHA92642.1 Na/Pi cotransporter family protein [Bacillus sp. N1-1]
MSPYIASFIVFISIFLFGMSILRVGLNTISTTKLQKWLYHASSTPIRGLLTGALVTALLQSSSAVMVLTISLIAAKLLTFRQSIGIILGTNIGTTITAELMTLNPEHLVLPLLLTGFIMLQIRHQLIFSSGTVLFGLGCIFVAMHGLEALAIPLSTLSIFEHVIHETNSSLLYGIGLGTLVTAVIQSSSATTGITMGFINQELLTLPAAIAILYGSNVGTCITALMASIGSSKEAKLAAYAHVWINIIGVILFFPLIGLFGAFATSMTSLPDVQLAHVSILFNVLSAFLFLPFAGLLAKSIEKLHNYNLQ